MAKNYWLMKTEPDVFSFDHLCKRPKKTEGWDGVRNYQARNMMRDDFKKGDLVFIYHSRIADPAVVGIAEVVREGYPDKSALDPKEKYFDEKSLAKGESRWVMVDVQAKKRFVEPVTLSTIRTLKSLKAMPLIKKGMRLSIQPVTKAQWDVIVKLGKPKAV